jgi:RNA-directed DNA polymerase
MICKKHIRCSIAWLSQTYFEKVGKNNWIFVGKKEKKLTLFQIHYVPIKRQVLCIDLNMYDHASVEYFHKRSVSRSKNVFLSGERRSALARHQKGYFPVCDLSLFNGEDLEIHHVLPRRENADHSLKNLKLLDKLCHKQVEYSKDGNLRAAWLKKGILLSEKRMK